MCTSNTGRICRCFLRDIVSPSDIIKTRVASDAEIKAVKQQFLASDI